MQRWRRPRRTPRGRYHTGSPPRTHTQHSTLNKNDQAPRYEFSQGARAANVCKSCSPLPPEENNRCEREVIDHGEKIKKRYFSVLVSDFFRFFWGGALSPIRCVHWLPFIAAPVDGPPGTLSEMATPYLLLIILGPSLIKQKCLYVSFFVVINISYLRTAAGVEMIAFFTEIHIFFNFH